MPTVKVAKRASPETATARKARKALAQGRKIDGATKRLDALEKIMSERYAPLLENAVKAGTATTLRLDTNSRAIAAVTARLRVLTQEFERMHVSGRVLATASDNVRMIEALHDILAMPCNCARMEVAARMDSHTEVKERGAHWPGCHVAIAARGLGSKL